MEAPLGASALMHSSTLVIAGIVLVYKLAALIELSLYATYILLIWGSWTTLFAAFVACFQFELKIIMAYSTISSMGFLYCLLGLHAYNTMLNYLVIHAFIKIFFFLVVGAIMLHCNGCQDIRWMGGLLHYIPSLYVFFVTGGVSLAGLPYWSGYYCKSAAWFVAATNNGLVASVQLTLLLTTLCTYIYLARAGYLIFFGPKNGHRSIYRQRHQSILVTVAFWILSIAAAYSGALWTHMCNTTLSATHITLLAAYDTCCQLTNVLPYMAWWQLTFIYTTCLVISYISLLILIPKYRGNAYKFFFLYSLYYILLILYICI
jgi:NADH:ubiquinone oxidoreductase subunit 5 (subunit L)/multisubunit Na+/H+ antiporter MnhA subunit